MITKVLLAAAIVAVSGLAVSAQVDVAHDRLVVAADDGAKQPDKMQSDEMKPDDQAQPDDQSDDTGSAKMGPRKEPTLAPIRGRRRKATRARSSNPRAATYRAPTTASSSRGTSDTSPA